MTGLKTNYRAWLLASILGTGALAAAPFDSPREGPVAFRRDRVPLDVEMMTSLSNDLEILAQAQRQELPQDRRITAQIIALSLALNPANNGARELVQKLAKGEVPRRLEKRVVERSRAKAWHTWAWLSLPEVGPDGQALASCLADVLSYTDPDHPKAAALLDLGEKGAWKNWVAEIDAFREEKPIEKESLADPSVASAEMPPNASKATILLSNATISTPLWTFAKGATEPSLGLVPVTMTAVIEAPLEGSRRPAMALLIDHSPEARIGKINRVLRKVLEKHFGSLPENSVARVSLGPDISYLQAKNGDSISGASAVLLGSALSGREPVGTVIGRIDEQGSFKTTANFWDQLRAISKGPGGRFVIPAQAAEYLPSILALEDPEFFLKYDVIYASDFTELQERSAKITASPLTETLAKFEDIRAKGASFPIGQYIANRFIRQRLIDLSAEAPYFASAKLLAVQAAGERPTRLPRRILAFELRRALLPMAWIAGKNSYEINVTDLDKAYELCRVEVDRLERYVDTVDRDFHGRVRDMTTTMRTFSRATRVGANRDNGAEVVETAYESMRKSYNTVIADLANVIGEPEPDVEEAPATE